MLSSIQNLCHLDSPLLIYSLPFFTLLCAPKANLAFWLLVGFGQWEHQQETEGREAGEAGVQSSRLLPALSLRGNCLHTVLYLVLVSAPFSCPCRSQGGTGAPMPWGGTIPIFVNSLQQYIPSLSFHESQLCQLIILMLLHYSEIRIIFFSC